MASITELEELVSAANQGIKTLIERGQEVRVNGKYFRRADLAELRDMRNQFEAELARKKRGGLRVGQVVPRG